MSAIQEKLTYFKHKQKEIVELHEEIEPKRVALVEECRQKHDELEAEYVTKCNELTKPLDHAKEKYKAELKSTFGVTDGEKINVMDVVEMVTRVNELT